jgi:hypothetical protein
MVGLEHPDLRCEQYVVAVAERHGAVGVADRPHALYRRRRVKLAPRSRECDRGDPGSLAPGRSVGSASVSGGA